MDHQSRFILMVVWEVPAIVLSGVIVVHLVLNYRARSELRNHGWIALLIANFIQLTLHLPMPISYYHLNYIWPATNAYCVWWTWCEYSLNSIGLFLMGWISVERHLFIFHSHTVHRGRWKKGMFHFIPLIFSALWAPSFFFVIVVISPLCTQQWDLQLLLCGFPCYYAIDSLAQFDFIFDIAFPIMIIMLANVTLVIRVVYQQASRQRAVHWQRHRKMVLQLWMISSLYTAFWFPVTITILVQETVAPSFMADQVEIMQFIVYFIPLCLPMICLSTLPELVKKLKSKIPRIRRNAVGVVTRNRTARQIATGAAARQ